MPGALEVFGCPGSVQGPVQCCLELFWQVVHAYAYAHCRFGALVLCAMHSAHPALGSASDRFEVALMTCISGRLYYSVPMRDSVPIRVMLPIRSRF